MSQSSSPLPIDPQQTDDSGLKRRQLWAGGWKLVFLGATSFALLSLIVLFWYIISRGWDWLSWGLLTNPPSRKPEIAGLNIAIYGTLWIISLTILVAFPLGVGAAIYLQEYAPKNRFTKILQINISNLAGVPSVVYGLLGLGNFVEWLGLGRVVYDYLSKDGASHET